MLGSRGGGGGGVLDPPPLRNNHKKLWFLSNTGPDPLEIHKATKPAFNVGPSSALQQMAFRWRANDDPHLVVFGSSLQSSTEKNDVKVVELEPL